VKQQRGFAPCSQHNLTGAPIASASSPCRARQASGRRDTVAASGQPPPTNPEAAGLRHDGDVTVQRIEQSGGLVDRRT
jgi:hypothetical protein